MNFNVFLTVFFTLAIGVLNAQNDGPNEDYIITIKETAIQPLVLVAEQETDNRLERYQKKEAMRSQKLGQLRNMRSKLGINEQSLLFECVDIVVAFAASISPEQANIIRSNPDVEQIEKNITFVLEKPLEEPESTPPSGQVTPCAITNAGGFDVGDAKTTYIWIMDTGIDTDHPDLNVITDPNYAKSFVNGQTIEDIHGHGTHVAGIAAAKNNGIGTVGVSAGAKVVPIKVLADSGLGSSISIINGLNHIAQKCQVNDVATLSFSSVVGTNCENSLITYRNAIRNLGKKGVWVCIAAGNDGCDATKVRPACINGDRILTVGAMTCTQKCASFSNWGSEAVDWVATGEKVYSTYKNGGYKTLSGTSMAAPVVAGICHARGAAPLSDGLLTCNNTCTTAAAYKKAKR
jgi:Subtilase family/Peptidase inhibitor I9